MSYRVDAKTMLFTDLSDREASDLYDEVESLVMTGDNVYNTPAFQAWAEGVGCDDRKKILFMAVVYPQRALLSLIHRKSF